MNRSTGPACIVEAFVQTFRSRELIVYNIVN